MTGIDFWAILIAIVASIIIVRVLSKPARDLDRALRRRKYELNHFFDEMNGKKLWTLKHDTHQDDDKNGV